MKNLYVINARGEKEPFSIAKIRRSAIRIGASKELARDITRVIEKRVYPGIKTSNIAKEVRRLLSLEAPKFALKFRLKEGMRKLGPTGFPFERYIGEILVKDGFEVKLNQRIRGACCLYEIDFVAIKKKFLYIGECKYRNFAGEKIDSNVALEHYARFLDIKNGPYLKQKRNKNLKLKPVIITNVKFTGRTIKYSECVGIDLLGWRYPEKNSLEILIDEQKLYPITILPSLKSFLIDFFVAKGMMLVKDVLEINPKKFAKESKMPLKYLTPLVKEAKLLLE